MTTLPGFQKLAPPPESKPQPGTGIDWSHKFAQGLIAAVPYNDPIASSDDFCVKDYVSGVMANYKATTQGNPHWFNAGTVKGLSGAYIYNVSTITVDAGGVLTCVCNNNSTLRVGAVVKFWGLATITGVGNPSSSGLEWVVTSSSATDFTATIKPPSVAPGAQGPTAEPTARVRLGVDSYTTVIGSCYRPTANLWPLDGFTVLVWGSPKYYSTQQDDGGTTYLATIAGWANLQLARGFGGGGPNCSLDLTLEFISGIVSLDGFTCRLYDANAARWDTDLPVHWAYQNNLWAASVNFNGTFTANDLGPSHGTCRFYNQWGPIRNFNTGVYEIGPTGTGGVHYTETSSGAQGFSPGLAAIAQFPGSACVQYGVVAYNYAMSEEAIKELMVNPLQMFYPTSCGGGGYFFPITPPITHDPPTVTLTATPNSGRSLDLSVLAWTSTNADTLSINQGIGSVAVPSGSYSVYPAITTTYTITATNDYGTATATATFTVTLVRRTVPGILQRDLTKTTDIGFSGTATAYTAYATIGNIVLAQPSELALLLHITTESLALGTKAGVSVLLDEIAATIAVPFTALTADCHDPAILVAGQTLYADRYYISESRQPAACRHLQVKISWPAEAVANELLTWSIVGASVEDR